MRVLKNLIAAHLVFFSISSALASVVQPGDGPYLQVRRHQSLYIYDPTTRDFIESLAAIHGGFRTFYDQSFDWHLDEEQALILASARQQVANASATTLPSLKSIWFPSGAGQLDEMAESSWVMTLVSHETAHLYQLNAKGPTNAKLKKLFGQSLFVRPLIWPMFLEPNLLTPTSFIEGNAVLNESRVNLGGRLHSGEKRALVLAQIADGQLDATRLINDEFKFPFGESGYLHGGYFQAHLAAKYGVDKTNQFFKAQGEHFLFPLILNDTFRQHFGTSFYQEVHEHVHELSALASRQRHLKSAPLAATLQIGPLNHDDKSIWWLSTDGHTLPKLQAFDRTTRKIASRSLDIPFGKVFFDQEVPLVSSSQNHNLHQISYSLYGEGAQIDPRFESQIVTDQRAGHTVALDAKNSWLDPHILVDGQNYDIAHSKPIIDRNGNIYYFRQNGLQRLIYRNREPLAKFDGYYGKLTEVTPDGAIYFIGNTDYGSSLFRYKDGEFARILESDRVIDARWVEGRSYLVLEVSPHGHQLHLSEGSPSMENPAVYNYAFPMTSVPSPPTLPTSDTQKDEESYSAIAETRFSNLDATTFFTPSQGLSGTLTANFVDPLEYNFVSLGHGHSQNRNYDLASYSFTKYLADFFIQFQRVETKAKKADETILGLSLPILRRKRWDSNLSSSALLVSHEDMGAQTSFNLYYRKPTLIGFLPWTDFQLRVMHRYDRLKAVSETPTNNKYLIHIKYEHALPQRFYLTGMVTGLWSNKYNLPVFYDPLTIPNQIELHRLTPAGDYLAQRAGSLRMEAHKDLDYTLYSSRFPLGINRLALVGIAQMVSLDILSKPASTHSIFEGAWGLDAELLLAHKLTMQMRMLMQVVDFNQPQSHFSQASLNLKQDF